MVSYDVDFRDRDREQFPTACPECGGGVREETITGEFHVHGVFDRKSAREGYGVEAVDGDVIRWIGLDAACENCDWRWLVVIG